MGILNLSKAPQVTKTGIEGVQNQRNLQSKTKVVGKAVQLNSSPF